MNKKINSTDVGERINDTKKEIAQLSEELERLIKSNSGNMNGECDQSYVENSNIKSIPKKDEDFTKKSTNVESVHKKGTGRKPLFPEGKTTNSELAFPKKNIAHSKEATREFMRQQREKREEQRKKSDCKNKIDQELKKQKLSELQQKSLALLQRNIQLKRERSKSRERKEQIRIDKSNVVSSSGAPPSNKPSTDSLPLKKRITEYRKPAKMEKKPIQNPKTKIEMKNELAYMNNFHEVGTSRGTKSVSCESKKQNSAKALEKEDLPDIDRDLAAKKIQLFYKGYRHRKQLEQEKRQSQQKKENPIKESKETQTSSQRQIEFPAWLQPPTVDPYPCNFINTIKKKLQLVVNSSVGSKDVGVQSSILETKTDIPKSYENSQKLMTAKSTSNKKVNSHSQKGTNLDADALQHFALINFREKLSQNNREPIRTDSESDTSKNIPEISTESGLVTDEKIELITKKNDIALPINTENIKNLTLRKPTEANISKKSYTFKFSEDYISTKPNMPTTKEDEEESYSKKLSRSPRDSILSFNISLSPTNSSITSQKDKQISESISNEEIKTEISNISQGSSRKKLIFPPREIIKSNKSDNSNTHKTIGAPLDRISSISQISEENKNSSHLSSHSSKINSRRSNFIQRKEETLGKQRTHSKFSSLGDDGLYSDKFSKDNHSDSSEIIKTSSMNSLLSTTSSKFSNPSTLAVPLEMTNLAGKSPPQDNIHSLLNSLKSNKSNIPNSAHEVISEVSEIDASRNALNLSQGESNENNIHKETKETDNQNLGENSNKPEKISNSNDKKVTSQMTNFKSRVVQSKGDTNEIHLKFEAEVHLLNDFNESLKQFMAVEKAFESLKNKNECSFRNSSKNSSALISSNLSRHIGSTINTSRGSDLEGSSLIENSLLKSHLKSNNNLELSNAQKDGLEDESFSFNDNIPNNLAGLSIKMFEQFIKDEDIRIENLKTIIKIREQALLDRTKGELAWLEIQRKHLKETGKLYEASLVKKKQRGILLKHQQERREMQRLKQLQKIKSNERKTILKEQKNLIKAKLTSEKVMSELKIQTPRKQRPSGPLKVFKASESHSETSLSRIASDADEIFSITSRSRSIKLSEVDSSKEYVFKQEETDIKKIGTAEDIDKMKKALLVRQDSLMKRRKAVEDLLKRHQTLLEEEKKIKELEMTANAIIMQLPSKPASNREPKIKSHMIEVNQKIISSAENNSSDETSVLNSLHKSTTEKKNDESEMSIKTNISRSESSFDTYYENAKSTISKMKIKSKKYDIQSVSSNGQKGSSVEYSEDFESDNQHFETESNDNNISSISELIEDFTQIEHGISMLSKQFDESTIGTAINLEKVNEFGPLLPLATEKEKKETLNSLTEEVITENDEELSAFHDIIDSSTTYGSSSQQEGKQILSTKVSGEISSSVKLNIKSTPIELLSSKSQNEGLIESENILISSEIEKEVSISTENATNHFGSGRDSEEIISNVVSMPDKSRLEFSISNKQNVIGTVDVSKEISESDMNVTETENGSKTKTLTSDISIPTDNFKSQTWENVEIPTVSEEIPKDDVHFLEYKSGSNENSLTDILPNTISKEMYKTLTKDKTQSHTLSKSLSERDIQKSVPEEENTSENMSIKSQIEIDDSTSDMNICEQDNAGDIIPENIHICDITSEEKKGRINTQQKLLNEKDVPIGKDHVKRQDNSSIVPESQYVSTNAIPSGESGEWEKSVGKTHEEPSSENVFTLLSTPLNVEHENEEFILTEDVVNIFPSEREETYKDITSIGTTTELYISEIKTDDSNKDVSEINDAHELTLENAEFKKLGYTDVELSDHQASNKSIEIFISNENCKPSSEEVKSQSISQNNFVEEIDVESCNPKEIESEKDISHQSSAVSGYSEEKEKDEIPPSAGKIISEVSEEPFIEENEEDKESDETDVMTEQSIREDTSSNSYTDDFEDEKEEFSIIQENIDKADKSLTSSRRKDTDGEKNEVLMVKIDLSLDPSKKEANIFIMNEDSNVIPHLALEHKKDEFNQDEDKLKSPIQQRVSQILANTVGSQKSPRDKDTRYQDYYVTTYEDITPVNSPESASPVKSNQLVSINTFNNEAEELLKKQLAIELEIKHLEQQQKEQLPFVYMREIPNKPPPPYTPPSTQSNVITILPNKADELKEICRYSAKVLYNAYLSNNLHAATFSESDFRAINKTKISKECCLFVFDLSREIAENHYKHFQTKKMPSWLKLADEAQLILGKPFNYHQLENHIHIKVMELLGFEKTKIKENSVMRWSKKKKDHVDEILVLESQAEEQEWLNYDNDELMVKNEVTDAILDMLLRETIEVYKDIFS